MMRAMLAVVALGVVMGLVASTVWNGRVGVAAAVLVIVLGAVILTLRRNQADLREIEAGRDPTPRDITDPSEEDERGF